MYSSWLACALGLGYTIDLTALATIPGTAICPNAFMIFRGIVVKAKLFSVIYKNVGNLSVFCLVLHISGFAFTVTRILCIKLFTFTYTEKNTIHFGEVLYTPEFCFENFNCF